MNKKNNGGPAFPKPDVRFDGEMIYTPSGMTLRDWFAGMCMNTMIQKSSDDGGWDHVAVAVGCYLLADAMLTERKKDL